MVMVGVVLLMLLMFVWRIAKRLASSPRNLPAEHAASSVLPSRVKGGDSGGLTAWIRPLTRLRRAADSIRIRLRSGPRLGCSRCGCFHWGWDTGCSRDRAAYRGEFSASSARQFRERADIAYVQCILAMRVLELKTIYAG
jgi:hypothetical protein